MQVVGYNYRLYIVIACNCIFTSYNNTISTALSLAKKPKIIEAVEKRDKSRCYVAKEFSVAKSTVSLQKYD